MEGSKYSQHKQSNNITCISPHPDTCQKKWRLPTQTWKIDWGQYGPLNCTSTPLKLSNQQIHTCLWVRRVAPATNLQTHPTTDEVELFALRLFLILSNGNLLADLDHLIETIKHTFPFVFVFYKTNTADVFLWLLLMAACTFLVCTGLFFLFG